jgi:hypothetical protein
MIMRVLRVIKKPQVSKHVVIVETERRNIQGYVGAYYMPDDCRELIVA